MFYTYDNINNYTKDDYRKMYNSLNQINKNKIDKLKNTRDKKLSILSKYLLKTILSQKYQLDYNNIYNNENNKPLIKEIYFNISHSHDYVALVFSNNKVGIDIEKIRKVNINIINAFCTKNEKRYILNSKDKYNNLFKIYTMKEAYFKMIGADLFNIKKIDFINRKIHNLNIKQIYSIPEYIITIIEEIGE